MVDITLLKLEHEGSLVYVAYERGKAEDAIRVRGAEYPAYELGDRIIQRYCSGVKLCFDCTDDGLPWLLSEEESILQGMVEGLEKVDLFSKELKQ